jgi:hypothetical protein
VILEYEEEDIKSASIRHQWIVTDHTDNNELRTFSLASSSSFLDLVEWNSSNPKDTYMYKIWDAFYPSCPQHSYVLQRPGSGLTPTTRIAFIPILNVHQILLSVLTPFALLTLLWVYPQHELKFVQTKGQAMLAVSCILWFLTLVYTPTIVSIVIWITVVIGFVLSRAFWILYLLVCCRVQASFPTVTETKRSLFVWKLFLGASLLSILFYII